MFYKETNSNGLKWNILNRYLINQNISQKTKLTNIPFGMMFYHLIHFSAHWRRAFLRFQDLRNLRKRLRLHPPRRPRPTVFRRPTKQIYKSTSTCNLQQFVYDIM